jgi:adenylosuccinate synthase
MTKLDVLDGFDALKIATGYVRDGRPVEGVPSDIEAFAACRPVYEEWPGWKGPLADARRWEDLPAAAQRYVRRIEELTRVPVRLLSVGSERDRTIRLG